MSRLGARVTLLLVAAGLLVGGLAQATVQTSLHSFLPSDDRSVTTYDRLAGEYGGDPIVVLLESSGGPLGPDSLEPLVKLEGRLSGVADVAAVYGPGTLLNQVAGRAQDLLAQLAGRRDAEMARAVARAQRSGATEDDAEAAGVEAREKFDERYGPLIVSGLPGGAPTLSNPRFVERVVFDEAGRPRPQWRFVVPSHDSAAILVRPSADISASATATLVGKVRRTVDELVVPGTTVSVSGAPVLVAAMTDTATADVPVLGLIAVALVALALGAATWIRRSRRWAPLAITLVSMAGTVAVLGWLDRPLSLGVVSFGTVLLGLGCYYPSYVAVGARTRTVLVVALATAASLATMALSPIPLVRDLGVALGVGVLLAAGLAWMMHGWLTGAPSTSAPSLRRPRSRRGPVVALVAASAVASLGWLQLTDLDVRSDVAEFAGGLAEYDEAQHVTDVIGSSGELGVVLRGPDALTPEALAWLGEVQELAVSAHGDQLRPVVSAPSLLRFLGDGATASQIDAAMRILPEYLTQAAVTPDRTSAIISFGVRIDDLGTLRAVTEDLVDRLPPTPAGYEAEVTGLPVVVMRGEDLIAGDRLPANALGILVATLVLAAGLRRRTDALRAFGAAALATGTGFFLLWVTSTPLNPVTAALGALTAAVGCEFTVVQAEAARTGRSLLGRAVLVGAATSVTGYAVLVASDLGAVRSLGVVLSGATLLALAASWLVVRATTSPALAGPPSVVEPARELQHA